MKIDEVLESERIKMAKISFEKAFENYFENREKLLTSFNEENFKKELRRIKEYSIENLDSLKEKAISNLEANGIKVFEVKDSKEAKKILFDLIPEGEVIVKSKSNIMNEIEIEKIFEGRNEIVETDCGDFIVKICNEKSIHPVTPAIHLSLEMIVEAIEKKFGIKVEKSHEKVISWIKNYLREKILNSKIGLTGANFVTADGCIVIVENEGNISLITRLPEKHIIITGIDRILPSLSDAMLFCKALAVWGTGTSLPTYINIISSPSKTADIEKEIVYGAHGAKEVYLILLDNGRSEIVKKGLKEILYCINCGSCLYFCPVYRQIFDNYGLNYFGGIGVSKIAFINNLQKAFENGLYYCTTCQACKVNCPLEIDVSEIIRKLREFSVNNGMETEENKKMIKNIREYGNPFGKVEEGKIPKELYCC